MSHGTDALTICSIVSPVTSAAAYRHTPTGGVINPNAREITNITTKAPKYVGDSTIT